MEDSNEIGSARYRPIRRVAAGGMGEIWLARLSTGRGFEKTVVLKRLLPHLAEDAEFLARFLDEARIAAALVHPNIVPVFELSEDDDGCFLVMEHIDGVDLRTLMNVLRDRGTPLDVSLALYVAREIATALDYAHTRLDDHGHPLMIVHRDVSPSNILLGRDGGVRLTDFGIAAARVRLGRTATGHLRGKFAYMSPEQASGRPIDARSDVFALGIVLFEMLAGRRPFDGDGELAILEQIRVGDRPRLETLRPEVPPAVVALVDACLVVDRDQRVASAALLSEQLDELLHAAGSPVGRRDVTRLVRDCAQRVVVDAETSGPSVGLDTLLRQQLDQKSDSVSQRVGGRTPSRSGRVHRTPPNGGIRADATRTTADAQPVARRRRKRRAVPALIAGAAMLLVVLGLWASVALSRVALTVQSEPTGASVFIDGAPAGVTALRTRLPRDSRLIRVEKPGFESFEREVDLRDGPVVLDVVLETAPALVTVESVPPGAHVEIDGIAPFTAGTSVSLPTSRPLRVRMSAPGYQPWSGELTVVPGQQSFSQRLEPLPDVSPSDQLAETDVDVVAVAAPTDRTERTERAEHAPSETPDASTPDAGVATPEVTPETGRVVVRFVSEPRVGEVRIDGQRVDVSGLATELPVAAGQHRIEVSNAAHAREFEAVIDVVPDSTTVVAVEW